MGEDQRWRVFGDSLWRRTSPGLILHLVTVSTEWNTNGELHVWTPQKGCILSFFQAMCIPEGSWEWDKLRVCMEMVGKSQVCVEQNSNCRLKQLGIPKVNVWNLFQAAFLSSFTLFPPFFPFLSFFLSPSYSSLTIIVWRLYGSVLNTRNQKQMYQESNSAKVSGLLTCLGHVPHICTFV